MAKMRLYKLKYGMTNKVYKLLRRFNLWQLTDSLFLEGRYEIDIGPLLAALKGQVELLDESDYEMGTKILIPHNTASSWNWLDYALRYPSFRLITRVITYKDAVQLVDVLIKNEKSVPYPYHSWDPGKDFNTNRQNMFRYYGWSNES